MTCATPEPPLAIPTPRLVLSPLSAEDAPALFAYRSDPGVRRFQGFDPREPADAERFIADIVSGACGWRQFGMRLVATGALAGDIGYRTAEDGMQAEVGVTVAPEHQGRGLASEALRALVAHLFGTLGLHRVYASVDPRNTASMRLFASLGWREEALLRESVLWRGEWADDAVFALLHSEWEG